MTHRLPWQSHPEGGFIAYPEGKEQRERFARLTPFTTGPKGAYSWSVRYDGQAITDVSGSKQAASDAANEAWPRVIERAQAAAERSAWEARQLDMIAAVERGEIGPEYFANEAARYENMMWVMDRLRPKIKPGAVISAGLRRLVEALSDEFARRRK